MAVTDEILPSNWKVRRPMVIAILLYCALHLAYLTVYGKDNELHRLMALGDYALAASTIGSYLFNASWDNKSILNFQRPQAPQFNMGMSYPMQGYPQPLYDANGQPLTPGFVQPQPAQPLDDRPR